MSFSFEKVGKSREKLLRAVKHVLDQGAQYSKQWAAVHQAVYDACEAACGAFPVVGSLALRISAHGHVDEHGGTVHLTLSAVPLPLVADEEPAPPPPVHLK